MPLISVLIFYIAGIILQKNFSYFSYRFLFLLCIIISILSIISYKTNWSHTGALLLSFFLLFGMLNTSYHSQPQGDGHIARYIARTGFLEGTVREAEYLKDGNYHEILLAAQCFQEKDIKYKVRGNVLLRIYEGGTSIKYGDQIKVKVKLEEPALPGNFGEFNYREYLMRKNIFIVGSLNTYQVYSISRYQKSGLANFLPYLKDAVEKNINKIYHFPQNTLIKAIITGDRKEMPPEWEPMFQDAGVMHILAISGLHIGVIAGFLLIVFNLIPVLKKKNKLNYIVIICFLLSYAALTGFRPSVSRATLMFTILLMAKYLNRPYHIYNSLYLAGLLILFGQPLSLFDAGFLLSFTVTFFIIFLFPLLKEKLNFLPDFISSPLATSLAAWLGMVPLSAYFFYKVSFIAILANLIIVPLISIILILGLASIIISFIFIPCATLLVFLNEILINFLIFFTRFFSSLPYAYKYVAQPSIYQNICYYFMIFLLAYTLTHWSKLDSKKMKNLCLTIGAAALMILFIHSYPFPSPLVVHFINVGQGDAILIQTPQKKNILIDGGGTPFTDFDVGKYIVVPYLRRLGINRVDLLFLTHPDLDHLEGLLTVLKEIKVKGVIESGIVSKDNVYQQFLSLIKKDKQVIYHKAQEEEIICLEPGLEILVLNSFNSLAYGTESNFNNHSIVLKLLYKNTSFLFTGDIEELAEKNLLSLGNKLKSDILKVAHHGSITSSSELFVSSVEPGVAVISVGLNNFNHPHPEVIKRLEDRCQQVFRTDRHGTIIITSNGQRYRTNTLR